MGVRLKMAGISGLWGVDVEDGLGDGSRSKVGHCFLCVPPPDIISSHLRPQKPKRADCCCQVPSGVFPHFAFGAPPLSRVPTPTIVTHPAGSTSSSSAVRLDGGGPLVKHVTTTAVGSFRLLGAQVT